MHISFALFLLCARHASFLEKHRCFELQLRGHYNKDMAWTKGSPGIREGEVSPVIFMDQDNILFYGRYGFRSV